MLLGSWNRPRKTCKQRVYIPLVGALFLVTIFFSREAVSAHAASIALPPNAVLVKLGQRFQGKRVFCYLSRSGPRIGFKSRRKGKLVLQRLRVTKELTRKEARKVRAMIAQCAASTAPSPAPTPTPTPTPRVCHPQASSIEIQIIENTDTDINLPGSSDCQDLALEYRIAREPQSGNVSIAQNIARYSLGFFSGADTFQYQACVQSTGECSAVQTVSLSVAAREFSGRSQNLDAYKDRITEREARYLVKKVALGGCQALVDLGVSQGLSAMVDTMLDDPYGGCSYALPLDNSHGYNPTEVRPGNRDPDAYAYWMAHPAHWGLSTEHWVDASLYKILTVNARYHSPLREYMAWMVWHPNFATYARGAGYDAKRHYNSLDLHALGYFGDYLRDFYGPQRLPDSPAEQRVPGVDPQLSYNPDKSASDGTPIYPETGPYPAYGDKLYQTYLSNEQNSIQRLNENLGRELLEINLTGTNDVITGARNYLESDVVASTFAISGLAFDYDGQADADGNIHNALTATGPDAAGGWRTWLGFFPSRSPVPTQRSITIFGTTPYERTAVFSMRFDDPSSENYFDFLLNDWAAPSRHIGAKLFTQLVHQDLNEEVVSRLAANLLTYRQTADWRTQAPELKNYSISEALRLILKSQAMFSERAYGHGVTSPFEMVMQMFRLGDVPILAQGIPGIVTSELDRAGHLPLAPPNVFGWQSFGTIGQGIIHDGSAWLNTTGLLGVYRAITLALNHTFLPAAGPPSLRRTFFPNGGANCNSQVNTGCPTAPQLVDHLLTRFNLNGSDPISGEPIISAEERAIFIEQLDRPGSPWPTATLGSDNVAGGLGMAVGRTMGLVFLISTHPANFRK